MHDYDKYQNPKTTAEYYELLKDKIYSEEYRNKLIEIPIFRNCEFDISRLSENYDNFINKIFQKEQLQSLTTLNLKSTLSAYLSYSRTSYLAPAYNYNCYINLLIEDNLNRVNNKSSLEYTDTYYTIITQNILISIKSLLDRMVPIFSFYYSGFSLNTTFGHLDLNTNRGSGFMKHVQSITRKTTDPLMSFIYEEYCSWINRIVEPRDTIIHYNDLCSEYRVTHDNRQFPMHHHTKIFGDSHDERTFDYDDGFYYKSLMKNIQDTYYFFDTILNNLTSREIICRKDHFITNTDYDNYKNT